MSTTARSKPPGWRCARCPWWTGQKRSKGTAEREDGGAVWSRGCALRAKTQVQNDVNQTRKTLASCGLEIATRAAERPTPNPEPSERQRGAYGRRAADVGGSIWLSTGVFPFGRCSPQKSLRRPVPVPSVLRRRNGSSNARGRCESRSTTRVRPRHRPRAYGPQEADQAATPWGCLVSAREVHRVSTANGLQSSRGCAGSRRSRTPGRSMPAQCAVRRAVRMPASVGCWFPTGAGGGLVR